MGNPWPTGPVKLLRHSFAISKPVISARLYVTALGAYRLQINGTRVGDQVLSPGWDDFRTQNLILLGHDEANRWLDPILGKLPLRLAPGRADKPRRIAAYQVADAMLEARKS